MTEMCSNFIYKTSSSSYKVLPKFSPNTLLKVNLGKMRAPQAASLFSPPSQQVQPHLFKTFLKSQGTKHKPGEKDGNKGTNRSEILYANQMKGCI